MLFGCIDVLKMRHWVRFSDAMILAPAGRRKFMLRTKIISPVLVSVPQDSKFKSQEQLYKALKYELSLRMHLQKKNETIWASGLSRQSFSESHLPYVNFTGCRRRQGYCKQKHSQNLKMEEIPEQKEPSQAIWASGLSSSMFSETHLPYFIVPGCLRGQGEWYSGPQ